MSSKKNRVFSVEKIWKLVKPHDCTTQACISMRISTSQHNSKCLLSGGSSLLKIQRHVFKISGDMIVLLLTRHWCAALRMSTIHIMTLGRNVEEPQASHWEDWPEQHFQQQRKHSVPTMMFSQETMTVTHSEKSNICQMKVWPYSEECRSHDPTKMNLLCC